jgi:hypothetical protein
MDESQRKAAVYRKHVADCMEVAERMSLREDRDLMLEMAERWLELARKAETGTD